MFAEDGISIPCSYTSWLSPIQCPKLHTEVGATRDKDKHPNVSIHTYDSYYYLCASNSIHFVYIYAINIQLRQVFLTFCDFML